MIYRTAWPLPLRARWREESDPIALAASSPPFVPVFNLSRHTQRMNGKKGSATKKGKQFLKKLLGGGYRSPC